MGAVTTLLSSGEYLVRPADRMKGGLNDWSLTRRDFENRRRLLRLLDLISDPRVTTAAHATRVAAAATLLAAPSSARRSRLAANSILASTTALLYPRHRYGTDGSDQVSLVVQTASALARMDQRRPRTVDACLWFVALQSALSYTASGYAKLVSHTWRSGQAIPGILRTRSYGDQATWEFLRRHPRSSKVLGHGVLALECTFPVVLLSRGRLAPAYIGSAAAFHLVNGRVMGLGRFLWSFVAMHPALLYVSAPRSRGTVTAGGEAGRDDVMPVLSGALLAGALAAGLAGQRHRCRIVDRGRGDEISVQTTSGNRLVYRRTGPADATGPVIVLEAGMLSTAETYEWVAADLAARRTTVTYRRAGYAGSGYGAGPYDLDVSVRDLVDLVRHAAGNRPVVLAGHSLGGYLIWLAANRLPGQVTGVCLLDSSHPAELQRSAKQAQSAERLESALATVAATLRLGAGSIVQRQPWIEELPAEVRGLAHAQYCDHRTWLTARREWREVQRHFQSYAGTLPHLDVPALVCTAEETMRNDPVQRELHDEFAKLALVAESHVIENVDHMQIVTNQKAAAEVSGLIHSFVDALPAFTGAAEGNQK
ncbi:alpha/beta fold hydrolase [Spirillospora sp. NBC_00431]